MGRPGGGGELGSKKFLDSYIIPSRYYQNLPAGPAPDSHSGSGSGSDPEDLEDRVGFESREVGHDL